MYIYCQKRGRFLKLITFKDIVRFKKIYTDDDLEIGNFIFSIWDLKLIYNQIITDSPSYKPMSHKALRAKARFMNKKEIKNAKKSRKGM